jgi:hypothetical protein
MIEITQSFKARIWLGEMPHITTGGIQWLRKSIRGDGTNIPLRCAVALEYLQPRGASFHYGLLGCEFHRNSSGRLDLQVAHQEDGELLSDRSLARGLDAVRGCIPLWAAEEILRTGLSLAERKKMCPGLLSFGFGCTGQLGSNVSVFRVLTNCVIDILFTNQDDRLEDLISAAIRENR